jgi:4-hydroxybenzoate polyprenyltransferase
MIARGKLEADAHATAALPLCVDLDGSLVRTDLLVEGILSILSNRHTLGTLAGLFPRSRACLKQRVAERAALDPALLPYNEQLMTYLRAQKAAGRPLVLATAADARVAHAVASHLGLFDEVICSDGVRNLKGKAKASALVERFGSRGFAYAGNDKADIPTWKAANSIVMVNVSRATRNQARKLGTVEAEINDRPSVVRAALEAMRPQQWVKNLLVFVPMIMAHAIAEPRAWVGALCMFGAFCVTASGIYIVNDLADLSSDRLHPGKRNRPFARGALPATTGLGLAIGLIAAGLIVSGAIGTLPIIVVYTIAATSYSLVLKEFPLVDVFMLAGLYTLRVLGGGSATGHPASIWLLAFSGFLFLSLALVKRTEEMMAVSQSPGVRTAARRGYQPGDVTILQIFGCSAAFASSVVLALFVGSTSALAQYKSPEYLWGIVPLILFWQCRLWLSTIRSYMHDDPIVYAARDWVSWVVVASVLALLAAAASGVAFFE